MSSTCTGPLRRRQRRRRRRPCLPARDVPSIPLLPIAKPRAVRLPPFHRAFHPRSLGQRTASIPNVRHSVTPLLLLPPPATNLYTASGQRTDPAPFATAPATVAAASQSQMRQQCPATCCAEAHATPIHHRTCSTFKPSSLARPPAPNHRACRLQASGHSHPRSGTSLAMYAWGLCGR